MNRHAQLTFVVGALLAVGPSHAAEYHVSVNGSSAGDGSLKNPWDLATALAQPSGVSPGDHVLLQGGEYVGPFTSRLRGTQANPIIVRTAPEQRVIITSVSSADALTIKGAWTWYWGFEVRYSDPKRTTFRGGSFPGDIHRGTCVTVEGPGTKLINLILHDCSQGIGLWAPARDAEVYGSLIYFNGWSGAGSGHGHGIYSQNDTGRKRIRDNIVFDQFGLGIQLYGSSKASVRGYELIGNVLFNNGMIGEKGAGLDNILIAGGGSPKTDITLDSNFSYHPVSAHSGYSRLGWTWDTLNGDITVRNNYWIGGQPAVGLWHWSSITFRSNTSYSEDTPALLADSNVLPNAGPRNWDHNRYYGVERFTLNGQNLAFRQWQAMAELDRESRFQAGRPTGTWSFVRPNEFDPTRAHIIVFNWDLAPTVKVDLTPVLKVGSVYEIRDAQNYFGSPILSAVYNGVPVMLPMRVHETARPVGEVPTPPLHTAPEFAVYILLAH
jgi:hypothetical protein